MTVRSLGAALLIAAAAASACGKRGDPLPPIRPVPGRIADLIARRVDDRVELRFTVPAANNDGTTPSAIDRIEIYRTMSTEAAAAPSAVALSNRKNLIGQITVRRPAPETTSTDKNNGGATQAPTTTPAAPVGPGPGELAIYTDSTPNDGLPASAERHYLLIAWAGRQQQRTSRLDVPMSASAVPKPVEKLAAAFDEQSIKVTWVGPPQVFPRTQPVLPIEPAGSLPPWLVPSASPPPTPVPAPPLPPALTPPAPTRGNRPAGLAPAAGFAAPAASVGASRAYRVTEVDESGRELAPNGPLPAPISATSFTAPVVFDKTRCFVVRTVDTTQSVVMEGPATPPVCVTPTDTFPPPAPTELRAFSSEAGRVVLTWTGVEASDLAGYIVLRGEGAGENMQPLNATPMAETTFTDAAATSGVAYVYAVIAVDRSPQHNPSARSNTQTIVAR